MKMPHCPGPEKSYSNQARSAMSLHGHRREPQPGSPALADAAIKARLEALDASAMPGSPANFGKLIADETERWSKVIRTTGIKAEQDRSGWQNHQ
jgi:hypothetical protein